MDMRINETRYSYLSTAKQDSEVFSAQETQQLQEMLSFSKDDIDAMVALVQDVFLDATRFGKVDRHALLTHEGVDPDVVAMLEKVWRKKGKALLASEPFAGGKHPMDLANVSVLRATEWRLHLEMGQSKLRGHTTPTAIFQVELAAGAANAKGDEAVVQKDEKVDLEMNHDELRAFFHELNAIQAHLDRHAHAA
ncbi:hypothetical protein FI667_g10855, partial [Globisporangium splendens]